MPPGETDAGHGAAMDAMYRWQRHIYDVTRPFFLAGRNRLVRGLDVEAGQTVLEVGCGTGRNLIAASRRWPGSRCYGIDISAAMLMTARQKIKRSGVGDRIMLTQGDGSDFDPATLFGIPRFDRVMLSYSLSMIPDWQGALRCAIAALAPGGTLAIVDFGTHEGLPDFWTRFQTAWVRRNHVEPRTALLPVLAGLTPGWERETVSLWRGYTVYVRVKRPADR